MRIARCWTVAAVLLPLLVWAAPNPEGDSEPAAGGAPQPHWRPGPAQVDLGHELTLRLSGQYVFLEKGEAARLLEQNGSFNNDNLLGVVASRDESAPWVIILRYADEGYIRDDEELDAEELLDAIKAGTEEANQERVARGFKPLHVSDWTEAPYYDKERHHLVWALEAVSDSGTSVNYSTRVLGRRGYVSMNLVVAPEGLAASKPHVARLLESVSFNPGARYEDFQAGSDKVAGYGLSGLVLGGVGLGATKLVKLGFFAKAWKLLLGLLIAGKKGLLVLLLLVVVVGGLLSRLFGGKKTEAAPPVTPGE